MKDCLEFEVSEIDNKIYVLSSNQFRISLRQNLPTGIISLYLSFGQTVRSLAKSELENRGNGFFKNLKRYVACTSLYTILSGIDLNLHGSF